MNQFQQAQAARLQVQAQQAAKRQQAEALSRAQAGPNYQLPPVTVPQKEPIPRWVIASAALGLVVVLGSTFFLVWKSRSK